MKEKKSTHCSALMSKEEKKPISQYWVLKKVYCIMFQDTIFFKEREKYCYIVVCCFALQIVMGLLANNRNKIIIGER